MTNHTLMTDALVFRSMQNEINHTSTAGAFRLFYAIIIPAEVRNGKEHTKLSLNKGIATPDDNSGCLYVQVPKRSAIKECPSPRDADVLEA